MNVLIYLSLGLSVAAIALSSTVYFLLNNQIKDDLDKVVVDNDDEKTWDGK